MKRKYIQFFIAVLTATILVLTAHIYIQRYATPILNNLVASFHPTIIFTKGNPYPWLIDVLAYCTAFIDITLIALVYYVAEPHLHIKNKLVKGIFVGMIICEIKGYLIRQPFMNIMVNIYQGAPHPIEMGILPTIDVWAANLLLGLALVYLCPKQKSNYSSTFK